MEIAKSMDSMIQWITEKARQFQKKKKSTSA